MCEEKTVVQEIALQNLEQEEKRLLLMRKELSLQQNIAALRDLEDTGKVPKSLSGKMALADQFAKSSMVPEVYKGKPENCFIALSFGEMIGINNPMSCFHNIYIVGGRPSTSADCMLGCVMVQPEFLDYDQEIVDLGTFVEADVNTSKKGDGPNWKKIKVKNLKSITRITRKMPNGKEKVFERYHTVEMSIDRFGTFPQWISDTENMLKHRSDSKACRSSFPAVFAGVHNPDELRELEPAIEVQDGRGNSTGFQKAEKVKENVVNDDLFSNASVKGGVL